MGADVLYFPKKPVEGHCSACEHALVGLAGIYCSYWHEEVAEASAKDCEEYDPW